MNFRFGVIVMQMTGMPADYGKVRYKFFMEAGWGTDLRVSPEFTERVWKEMIKTPGKILSVTPCFSTFGQSISNSEEYAILIGRW